MKHQTTLMRWTLAAGICLMLLAALAATVWASSQAGDGGSAAPGRPTAQPALPETDTPSARLSSVILAPPDPAPYQLSAEAPGLAIRRAWRQARETGVYRFSTNLVETQMPAPRLAYAGSSPKQNALALEGEVNLPQRSLHLRLQTGDAARGTAGGEARIEDGKAYIRRSGGEWQESEDFSPAFAPDADPLAWLAGIKNIRQVEETRLAGATRYAFELDGPAFSAYLRERLESQLRESGELPLNMTLDSPQLLSELEGDGELWIDARGHPLRLALHLVYPRESNGAHTEADVTTDFFGFPEPVVYDLAEEPVAGVAAALGLDSPWLPQRAAQAGCTGGGLAAGLGAAALIVGCRRSKRLYRAIVVAVVFSMVVIPLLQDAQALAFAERQAAQAARAAAAQTVEDEEAQRAWNPNSDPLLPAPESPLQPINPGPTPVASDQPAAPQPDAAPPVTEVPEAAPRITAAATPDPTCLATTTGDCEVPVADGLTNEQETVLETDPSKVDSDSDGLTDGMEAIRLGTDPTEWDTDGDAITDTLEVQGFVYDSKQWYLNPLSQDTNSDGLVDALECTPFARGDMSEASVAAFCDTDGDKVPSVFDPDNDNDGVPDRLDLSSDKLIGRNGVRSSPAGVTAFDASHPFSLTVQDLNSGWTTFVDLQLRPTDPGHLTYALNVLDWPVDDADGQIQRVHETTFEDSNNPDIANADDPAGGQGDMRLVPLLEIEMIGSSVPLKQASPAVTATLESTAGEFGAVELAQTGAAAPYTTNMKFTWTGGGSHTVEIREGTCEALDATVKTFGDVSSGSTQSWDGQRLAGLADGNHVLVVPEGEKPYPCGAIPGVVPVPGHDDRMVDLEALKPYGISVKLADPNTLVAYVPLNVLTDDTGGGRTAFSARMAYYIGDTSSWGMAQSMRIVWAVQAITDWCDDSEFELTEEDREKDPEGYDEEYDKHCESHRTMDELQVIQTYDESFTVTGLAVREDHGMDLSIAYPNPSLASYDDENLWELSWGLGQAFVPKRDCENAATIHTDPQPNTCHVDHLRDLTVYLNDSGGHAIGNQTIQTVWDADRPPNDQVTAAERLNLPINAFQVESFRYPTQDYLSFVSMTEVPRILEKFEKYGTGVAPTLLYAREENYRGAGLEAVTAGAGGGILTLSVGAAYKDQVLAGLNWAPYQYNTTAGEWEAYPIEEYWETLDAHLRQRFTELYDQDTPDAIEGRVMIAESYYMMLVNGVETDAPFDACLGKEECPFPTEEGESYEEIIQASEKFTSRLSHVTTEVVAEVWETWHTRATFVGGDYDISIMCPNSADPGCRTLFQSLGETRKEWTTSAWHEIFEGGWSTKASGALIAGAAVGAVVMTIISLCKFEGTEAVAAVLRGITTIVAAIATAKQLAKFVKEYHGAAVSDVLKYQIEAHGFHIKEHKAGVVALVIHVAVTWAAWGIELALGHMAKGSMAWDNSLANTIAATITAVVMFVVLSAIPMGELIAAVIGLIDALVAQICSTFLSDEQRESRWATALCGGITGLVTNYYKRLVYSGTLLPDMDPKESSKWYPRLALAGFSTPLLHPDLGVVEGNELLPTISYTNTIDISNRPIAFDELIYWNQFSEENLRTSTFEYRWQEEEEELHGEMTREGMPDPDWGLVNDHLPLRYVATVGAEEPIALGAAGINRALPGLFLSEGYALPEQECWGWRLAKYCSIQTEKTTVHYPIGEDLVFDVLPRTLSEFYALTARGAGYGLRWDSRFPTLADADGDGLLRAADVNDSLWDTDGDTLSDFYEQDTGSDPTRTDADHDGLTDVQEALLGTDPTMSDTDGDGLYDCQEPVHQVLAADTLGTNGAPVCGAAGTFGGGWSYVYGMENDAQLITWVDADPTQPDTDGDGLTDAQEKTYGYNPRAFSNLNVLSLTSLVSEVGAGGALEPTDLFVAPGQTLQLSGKIKNQLDNRQAEGLLSVAGESYLDAAAVVPQSFDLAPQQLTTLTGNVTVLPATATGVYSLTHVAGALIEDLTIESDNAALWLQFDDPVGSPTFADSSGLVPMHPGSCVGSCALDAAGGRVGGALSLTGTGHARSDVAIPAQAFSASFWLKVDAAHGAAGVLFDAEQSSRIQLYLNGGKICGYTPNGMSCPERVVADGAWHHVALTVTTANFWILYIDGIAAGQNSGYGYVTSTPGIVIGGKGNSNLYGALDDFRLFNRTLTADEVGYLANQPVFHMDFNSTTAWSDVSPYHTTITPSASPPAHPSAGVTGQAAGFDGTQYLSVTGGPQTSLKNGRFTLAAWVYPRNHGDARDNAPQGIIGLASGTADAYPSLQRVGKKVRFGLVDNGFWVDAFTSADVLTLDRWNHVALAYDKGADGLIQLYVNGQLVGSKSVPVSYIPEVKHFEIGRSADRATLKIYNYTQGEQGDGGLISCEAAYSSEMCMAVDKVEVWDRGDMDCTETDEDTLNVDQTFGGSTTVVLWEDDGGTRCGPTPTTKDNDDDVCNFTSPRTGKSLTFTPNDAPFGGTRYNFNSCGDGDLYIALQNNAIPFYGYLDEVEIFGQPLDQDNITKLYQDAATLLHLPFDEPPGARAFEDASLAHVAASCAGATCATSGMPGRLNQAAWFTGAPVQLGSTPAASLLNNFSVAAWINPRSLTGWHRIVSSALTKSNNGWALGTNGAELVFTHFGVRDYASAGAALKTNRWTHVAVVIDPMGHGTFFVNGAAAGTFIASTTGLANTDDALLVGATTIVGATTPAQTFDGQIDDLWIFNLPLTTANVTALYDQAPVAHLRLDETASAGGFADNANADRKALCSAGACPSVGEAVRGQVGLAAEFAGAGDRLSMAAPALPNFTVGAWVMPTAANPTPVAGLVHELVGKWASGAVNYRLYLQDDLKPGLEWGCTAAATKVVGKTPLILNHWNHVAGTFDGKTLRLYINGTESNAVTLAAAATCSSTADVEIGGKSGLAANQFFTGRIDEVMAYKKALTPAALRDLYLYQSAWVEDRKSSNLTVDGLPPTAEIQITDPNPYWPHQPTIVAVKADDDGSGIDHVTLTATRSGADTRTSATVPCLDTSGENAWCATFEPWGQQTYTFNATAVDKVGHSGAAAPKSVRVDDTPPIVAITATSMQRMDASKSRGKKQHYTVTVSGTVHDPDIASGVPGVGVADNGVTVTARRPDGTALGDPDQAAQITGENWTVAYDIHEADPTGCYDIVAEGKDKIAVRAGLDPGQAAIHTGSDTERVSLDGDAVGVQLELTNLTGGIGKNTGSIYGDTSARPVPVEVDWTTGGDGELASIQVVCRHGNAGTNYTLYSGAVGAFSDATDYVWETGSKRIHQGAQCWVNMNPTGSTGITGGVVKVCGVEVARWTTERTVPWVAYSSACDANTCGPSRKVAGVKAVEIAYRAVLPGAAFVNDAQSADEVLHLPFEDQPAGGVLTVADVAGANVSGVCVGALTTCPAAGQEGPSNGAFWFDGVDDGVKIADDDRWDFGLTQDFTVAFYVKPDAVQPYTTYTDHSIVEKWSQSGGYPYVLRYLDANDKTHPGALVATRYTGAAPQPAIYSNRRVDDGRYHHVAFVKSGSTLTLYIDGRSAGTTTDYTTGVTTNTSALFIGQRGNGGNRFAGSVDDLRIFKRGLTGAEVNALTPGPLLHLEFEKAWLQGGETLDDAAGWGNTGTLATGSGDAADKSVAGQVGDYAVTLDGANDAVTVPDFGGSPYATLAAWVYRTGATANRETIISYKELSSCGMVLALEGQVPKLWVRTAAGWYSITDGTNQVGLNAWTHLAGAYDGATLRLYRNGLQVASAAIAGSMVQCSAQTAIGAQNGATAHWFPGAIDDVMVFGRALPAPEVYDLVLRGWRAAHVTSTGENVETSAWDSAVPTGLEGAYRIALRGTDWAGRQATMQDPTASWSGEADTLGPRLTITRAAGDAGNYRYTVVAEDYNLATTAFNSPCGAGVTTSTEMFRSPWYLAAAGPSDKLYRITATCQKAIGSVAETAHACDTFGNCTDVTYNAALAASTDPDPAGATPSEPQAATGPEPGETPVADGAALTVAPMEPEATRPQIVFASQALTMTHYVEPGTINISGYITYDHAGLPGQVTALLVRVGDVRGPAILSEPASTSPFTTTWTFPWRLAGGELPDGLIVPVVATAMNGQGREYMLAALMPVDVAPPTPLTLTLTHAGTVLSAGDVLREPSPELEVAWTPAADGAGLRGYRVTWTTRTAGTDRATTRFVDPAGPLTDRYTAGEAELIAVEVVAVDRNGNRRAATAGPVLADGPLTPDFISLPPDGGPAVGAYAAWADNGCSLVGADRRLQEVVRRFGARRDPQRLYASWDALALRLTWTGAIWSGEGDLFIYLDTGPGGATHPFIPDPAPAAPEISFGSGLANWVVWVQDHKTASLMRWDGGAWVLDAPLGPDRFRFGVGERGGTTDLYLPFDALGTAAGARLGLLAFAADEPEPGRGLRLWASISRFNPLNSPRVHPLAALAPTDAAFLLKNAYRWEATGFGVCPNGSLAGSDGGEGSGDADLRLDLTSDPPGLTVNGLSGVLDWEESPDVLAQQIEGLLHVGHPPLQDGQPIVYTAHYRNAGVHTAAGVQLDLKARGQLHLLDGPVSLGDIAPGAEGQVTFRGVVSRDAGIANLAIVGVRIHDAAHPIGSVPLGFLWNGHRVDRGGPQPEFLGLGLPQLVIAAAPVALRGRSHDEAGMQTVRVEVTAPTGVITRLECPVERPQDGGWRCLWDPVATNGGAPPLDGEQFSLRLQGVDRFGQTGPWAGPWSIAVDAAPPELAITIPAPVASMAAAAPIENLTVDGMNLFGTVHDASAARVEVCMAGACGVAALLGHGETSWSYPLRAGEALDAVARTVEVRAIDRHDQPSDPMTVEVVFDNVAPALTANPVDSAASPGSTLRVLEGTITDGGAAPRLAVRIAQPDGLEARRDVSRDGDAWWFDLAADMPGSYTLWVDAEDAAGNRSSAGPFAVDVTCTDAALSVKSLTAQPDPAGAGALALTAVLANGGPAALDAGVTAAFAADGVTLGQAATGQALGAGVDRPVTLGGWTPALGQDFGISVAPSAMPHILCSDPAAVLFPVSVRDLTLDEGWSLVSPPLVPGSTAIESAVLGIQANYSAILGYDGETQSYDPARPQDATLATIEPGHGYWIKAARSEPPPPADDQADTEVGSWRMAGAPATGVTLTLASGWNLTGGPLAPLPVADALVAATGHITAALGFDRTGLSYYPDLDPVYNTLRWLEAGRGYWMAAPQAAELPYPAAAAAPSLQERLDFTARLYGIRAAEGAAGVQTTPTWANFYGAASLPSGEPVPEGTAIIAVADGAPCGAAPVVEAGRFGLLACYGDDLTTPGRDGARPGDTITFLVDGALVAVQALALDGAPVPAGTALVWPGHGRRWQAALGAPLLDLAVSKQAEPVSAGFGSIVTYTLSYNNAGGLPATGWAITDTLPAELALVAFTPGGTPVDTPAGKAIVWKPADLLPGASGVFTVTTVVALAATAPVTVTNTAEIGVVGEMLTANNTAHATLQVLPVSDGVIPRLWLPVVLRD